MTIIKLGILAATVAQGAFRNRIPRSSYGKVTAWRQNMDCFDREFAMYCTGYERKDRSGCGGPEDPCPMRMVGDVGVSMYNYEHPKYGKRNGQRQQFECGAIYIVTVGDVSFHGVIADYQPGYYDAVEVDINRHPDDYPWDWNPITAFDWMNNHWNQVGVASEYLEIEPTAWNAMFNENIDPLTSCYDPPGFGFNAHPEPDFTKKEYSMVFSGKTDWHYSRPNDDQWYQSKRFTQWNNYARAINGIPMFITNNETIAHDNGLEHSTKKRANIRTGGPDHIGANERWEWYEEWSGWQGEIVSGCYDDFARDCVMSFITSDKHHKSMMKANSNHGPSIAVSADKSWFQGICTVMQATDKLPVMGHGRIWTELWWEEDRLSWPCVVDCLEEED